MTSNALLRYSACPPYSGYYPGYSYGSSSLSYGQAGYSSLSC